LLALSMTGCNGDPPQFRLNFEGRDADKISLAQKQAIAQTLTELFGTPDEPRVPEGAELDIELLKAAAGPAAGDATGRQRGLYRQHCVACHGISGDGAGPTAALLTPYPRDFRNGLFKWISTVAGAKPTRDDLERTLRRGVPGTAMPSFVRLPDDEIQALIEYVRYLSIRGETELYLVRLVVDEDEYLPLNVDWVIEDGLLPAAQSWQRVERDPGRWLIQPPPEPPMDAASIELGRELYASKDAQCVKCHGPEGRGDGEETEIYDDWNKPKKGVTPEQTKEMARLFTLPIQKLRARDFREGTFRGGSRPVDLYYRVDAGIPGTPMPAAGPAGGTQGVLTPEEIWYVVHYIRWLARR
jgi:mono/diheme cytochrome c family protein